MNTHLLLGSVASAGFLGAAVATVPVWLAVWLWLLGLLAIFGRRAAGKGVAVAVMALLLGLYSLLDIDSLWLTNYLLQFAVILAVFFPKQRPTLQDHSEADRPFLAPPAVLNWPWYTRPIDAWDRWVWPLHPTVETLQRAWDEAGEESDDDDDDDDDEKKPEER